MGKNIILSKPQILRFPEHLLGCALCGNQVEYDENAIRLHMEKEHPSEYGGCKGCQIEDITDEYFEAELSTEQEIRIDEVYDRCLCFCRVLAKDPSLEYDIRFLGEIADVFAERLAANGANVCFPSIVDDGDAEYIEPYLLANKDGCDMPEIPEGKEGEYSYAKEELLSLCQFMAEDEGIACSDRLLWDMSDTAMSILKSTGAA